VSLLDRLPPQISAVEPEQIEGAMNRPGDRAIAADQLKDGKRTGSDLTAIAMKSPVR
jgi:hypothetical protein